MSELSSLRSKFVKLVEVIQDKYDFLSLCQATGLDVLSDFSGASLVDTDLSEMDLRGAQLQEANLTGATLKGSDLTGANLERACMVNCNLDDAILDGARLDNADIRGASLSSISLGNITAKNAMFGKNRGLDDSLRQKIFDAGGIFRD